MTLTEVVVSTVILGISSQVSLQGWARTSQAASTSARADQQVRLLEQRLLASRRVLASATVADADCRWDRAGVVGVLEGLPDDVDLSSTWQFELSGESVWLTLALPASETEPPMQRSQFVTPAGLGHCPREMSDAS